MAARTKKKMYFKKFPFTEVNTESLWELIHQSVIGE